MKRNLLYEVRSYAKSNRRMHTWGSFYDKSEAEHRLAQRTSGKNLEWAEKHHAEWWIEEIDVSQMFRIPPKRKPRERFAVRGETGNIEIVDHDTGLVCAQYVREFDSFMGTFEPFRQNGKNYALISPEYTATSVIDLQSGEIIAFEEPNAWGFCPVGFYVPDWWDVHDGSIKPGSSHWKPHLEKPNGEFGFVWGCVWGDDSSWKVQHLDLSKIEDGEISRDERYGYVELASHPALDAQDFIRVSIREDGPIVRFHVQQTFDIHSGDFLDLLD